MSVNRSVWVVTLCALPLLASAQIPEAGVEMPFVPIPPGEFVMGSDHGVPDEAPAHTVRITRGFELGRTEVTQALWQRIMGSNPSRRKGETRPVENVSWREVQE